MSGTPVTPESSARPRATRSSTRRLIDRMSTHYEEDPELQDEGDASFRQSAEFDDETTEVLQDKGKGRERSHSPAESAPSNPAGIPAFNGDPNQPIYCTAGNLMDLMQLMLQNQREANDRARQLTSPTPRDNARDELREYQKEVKYALDTKSVTTFDGSNYEAWRVGILADAEVIGGTDILMKNQRESPFTRHIDSEKWKIRSKALYRRMLSSLVGNVRATIGTLEADNAAALWDKINVEYAISLAEERVNVFKELTRLQVKDGDYLTYQRRFRYLIARHKELCQGTEDVYHDLFLNGLRDYQKTFVKSRLDDFFSTGQEPIVNMDIDDLMKQLTNRSSKKVGGEPKKQTQADAATTKEDKDKDNSKGEDNKDSKARKCTHCKKDGHTVDRCWVLHPELKKKKKKDDDDKKDDEKEDLMASQPSANAAIVKIGSYSTSTPENALSRPWFLDTCASLNMTGELHSFLNVEAFKGNTVVDSATGGVGRVEKIGNVILEVDGGDVKLQDVHYVPNLTVNLLSFAKLEDQGFRFTLSSTIPSFFICKAPNGVIFHAVRTAQSNIYKVTEREYNVDLNHPSRAVNYMAAAFDYDLGRKVDFPVAAATTVAAATVTATTNADKEPEKSKIAKTLLEWHNDLGHVHVGAIIAMAKDPYTGVAIKGSKTRFFCEECVKAGMTRSYSKTPMPRSIRPIEKVHIDLAGGGRTLEELSDHPLESRQGTKYWMLITCDATRYRWVYFLKTKDEAVKFFDLWLKFMGNLGYAAPAFLRTDIDGVFRSARMDAIMNSYGIKWEPTTPHSPHQDGVSERGIRTIMGRVRAVLFKGNLPKKFWADVLETVVAITNNTPTSAVLYNSKFWPPTAVEPVVPSPHKIPWCALTNAPPSVKHFRQLGAEVFVHLHGSQKPADKLSPRADSYRIVGFSGTSIYRLWSPEADKIIASSDVRFPIAEKSEPVAPATATVPDSHIAETERGSHFIDDEEAPEISDPNSMWLRPVKSLATYTPSPVMGNLPKSYKDAVSRPGGVGDLWKKSMQREITDLERRNTWDLIPRSDVPKDEPIAPGRWVFIEKDRPDDPNADSDGILRKSRWVICGNWLKKGSKEETYAPVITDTANRILFAIAALRGWTLRQVDIVMAYLHGRLAKRVYMRQPTGFEAGVPKTLVCAVGGSLYGLDPAAKIWYDYLTALLSDIGFIMSDHDPALWRHTSRRHLYMTIYVDDLNIISEGPENADWLVRMLSEKLDVKDLRQPTKYLGMEVDCSTKGIKLTHRRYVERLVEDFYLDDAVVVKTPMEEGFRVDDLAVPENEAGFTIQRYQHGVGCLQYLAVKTRPDIARAASLLAQRNVNPTPQCWKALLHVIRYLKGTPDVGIFYARGGPNESSDPPDFPNDAYLPIGYTDSDWAGVLNGDRKSTSGYVFKLADGPISWRSAKQPCVSLSSNEAEYVALSEAVREATWIRYIMIELEFIATTSPIRILADNKGAIDLTKVVAVSARSKHIDTRFHFSRLQLNQGVIELEYVPTARMAADGLTKPLGTVAFGRFMGLLGLTGDKDGNG